MNVRFILVDLESSFRALMNAGSAVEKRLHLINIRADIYESYKLLYGYGKSRQHTAWSKIGGELQALQESSAEKAYGQLKIWIQKSLCIRVALTLAFCVLLP